MSAQDEAGKSTKWKPGDRFFYVYAGAYACEGELVAAWGGSATVRYDNFDGKWHDVPLARLFKTKRACRKHFTRTA